MIFLLEIFDKKINENTENLLQNTLEDIFFFFSILVRIIIMWLIKEKFLNIFFHRTEQLIDLQLQ